MKYRNAQTFRNILIALLTFIILFLLFTPSGNKFSSWIQSASWNKSPPSPVTVHEVSDLSPNPLDTKINLREENALGTMLHSGGGLDKIQSEFEATLRNCIGTYCMDERFPSDVAGKNIQRTDYSRPDINVVKSALNRVRNQSCIPPKKGK